MSGLPRAQRVYIYRIITVPASAVASTNNCTLSMGHGRALLGIKNKEQLTALVNKIIDNHLNVRQFEQLINQLNNDGSVTKKEKKEPPKDIFIKERESILRERLGTGVQIHRGKRKGKIEIEFYSNDDLDR